MFLNKIIFYFLVRHMFYFLPETFALNIMTLFEKSNEQIFSYGNCKLRKKKLVEVLNIQSQPFCKSEQNLTFWENASISQVIQYRKKLTIVQLFGKNYRKMMSRHRFVKNRSLSNFYHIMIMSLRVNDNHAFESKSTYFMAEEKTFKTFH